MWGRECCTVFNRRLEGEMRREAFEPTVLEGVHWQGGGAVRDRKQPTDGNVAVYIPFSVKADRPYRPPRAYAACSEGSWTLREGDLLCLGAHPEPVPSARALLERGGVVTIVSVSENGFGSRALRHWEVCAR
ncbi:MAG: hypothetical protein HFG26_06225 [Provencibacterium sp.]|jgi:hypothetical protein|nr:hypothetical protein [Provencibacterium sp.]